MDSKFTFKITVFLWSPPDDRAVFGGEEEADGHDTEAVRLIHINRTPAKTTRYNLFAIEMQHPRDTRAAQINVQQTDLKRICINIRITISSITRAFSFAR